MKRNGYEAGSLRIEKLRQQVADRFQCRELLVCELSPTIATHVGPGTVGVAFYAEAQASV